MDSELPRPGSATVDFSLQKAGDTVHIAGVILHDTPEDQEYIVYLPESQPRNNSAILKDWTPQEWHDWLVHSDDPTFKVYTDENRRLVKAIVRKTTRQVDQNIMWAVYRRAGFKCEYCGANDRPLTYDHYMAQAYGGETTEENGRAACRPCNKLKGHKTIAEWEAVMRQRGWLT